MTLGDSVANNGACLTVVEIVDDAPQQQLRLDLLGATGHRTSLGQHDEGALVNLGRALPVGGRLSGHVVTGHVDAVASIRTWEPRGADHVLEVTLPQNLTRYCVPKGCIAIDGMSLTIADIEGDTLRFWIIPHTRDVTNLKGRSPGEQVNIEVDMLAKYVEKLTLSD